MGPLDLAQENALLKRELEETRETLRLIEDSLAREQSLALALADSNARAGELMASLEEAFEEQHALATQLADANALAMELMRTRDAERRRAAELLEAKRALSDELAAGATYVRSLLPTPFSADGVAADWRFVPSAELGGDAFGYHWVGPDHFAVYLLDVCGHGLAATLLATSVLTLLRAERLGTADFRKPEQVLLGLNEAFPMERHNNTYFTIWYGVYDRTRREMRYASAGHPPAVLLSQDGRRELGTPNPMIGIAADVAFETEEIAVSPSDRLFVFSDGVYEVIQTDGSLLSYDEFMGELSRDPESRRTLDDCITFAKSKRGRDVLDDDFSMVRLEFA